MEGFIKRPQAFLMRVRIYSDDDTPFLVPTQNTGGAFQSGSQFVTSHKRLGEVLGFDHVVYCTMESDGTFSGVCFLENRTVGIKQIRVAGGLTFSGASQDRNRLRITCRFTYQPYAIAVRGEREFSISVRLPSVGGLQYLSSVISTPSLNEATNPATSIPFDGIYTCYGGFAIGYVGTFRGTRNPTTVVGVHNGDWEVGTRDTTTPGIFYYGEGVFTVNGFDAPSILTRSTDAIGYIQFNYGYTCAYLAAGEGAGIPLRASYDPAFAAEYPRRVTWEWKDITEEGATGAKIRGVDYMSTEVPVDVPVSGPLYAPEIGQSVYFNNDGPWVTATVESYEGFWGYAQNTGQFQGFKTITVQLPCSLDKHTGTLTIGTHTIDPRISDTTLSFAGQLDPNGTRGRADGFYSVRDPYYTTSVWSIVDETTSICTQREVTISGFENTPAGGALHYVQLTTIPDGSIVFWRGGGTEYALQTFIVFEYPMFDANAWPDRINSVGEESDENDEDEDEDEENHSKLWWTERDIVFPMGTLQVPLKLQLALEQVFWDGGVPAIELNT